MKNVVVTSVCALGALLLAGHSIRRKSKWLRALHLPSSVVGGGVGFLFFMCVDAVGSGELADDWFAEGWNVLPGICTDIIFCALFLGTRVPSPGEILASPRREHFLYGLIVVFGQYVVAAACAIVFGWADPNLEAPFATVMPYGYAGGPVVAEAMKDLYAPDSFNYPQGYTLALLSATVGMFGGVIVGALLVNFAPLAAHAAHGGGGGTAPRRRGARRRHPTRAAAAADGRAAAVVARGTRPAAAAAERAPDRRRAPAAQGDGAAERPPPRGVAAERGRADRLG